MNTYIITYISFIGLWYNNFNLLTEQVRKIYKHASNAFNNTVYIIINTYIIKYIFHSFGCATTVLIHKLNKYGKYINKHQTD